MGGRVDPVSAIWESYLENQLTGLRQHHVVSLPEKRGMAPELPAWDQPIESEDRIEMPAPRYTKNSVYRNLDGSLPTSGSRI
jgi:hypothetical protein